MRHSVGVDLEAELSWKFEQVTFGGCGVCSRVVVGHRGVGYGLNVLEKLDCKAVRAEVLRSGIW